MPNVKYNCSGEQCRHAACSGIRQGSSSSLHSSWLSHVSDRLQSLSAPCCHGCASCCATAMQTRLVCVPRLQHSQVSLVPDMHATDPSYGYSYFAAIHLMAADVHALT